MEWHDWISLIAALLALLLGLRIWLLTGGSHVAASDELSAGQKWGVAKVVGTIVAGVAAVLGLAGYFAVENAATESAAKVAAQVSVPEASKYLVSSGDLRRVIQNEFGAIPAGAVVAFAQEAQPNDRSKGCPPGWGIYAQAAGRVIIGVGEGAGLQPRSFGDFGGAEMHTLTEQQMPGHIHAYGDRLPEKAPDTTTYAVAQGQSKMTRFDKARYTQSTGGGKPHNNMPPYIALYFCKKEG